MTRPSIILQAAEMRSRNYVGQHRTPEGDTLPVQLTGLLSVLHAEKLYRNVTADQVMHALRWGGWTEDRGFWAVPATVAAKRSCDCGTDVVSGPRSDAVTGTSCKRQAEPAEPV